MARWCFVGGAIRFGSPLQWEFFRRQDGVSPPALAFAAWTILRLSGAFSRQTKFTLSHVAKSLSLGSPVR